MNDRSVIKVKSQLIESIEYSVVTGSMIVNFKEGSSYTYKDTPFSIFEDFANAPSKGKYFLKNVRDKLESVKN